MRSKQISQIYKNKTKKQKTKKRERYSQTGAKLFLDLHALVADKLTQKSV